MRHHRRADAAARLPPHHLRPALYLGVERGAAAERVKQRRRIGQQLAHLGVERSDRERGVEAERLACGLGAMTETVPDFALDILLATEQDALRLAAARIGHQHHHRLRLGEAGQVVEVAVVAVRVFGVAVARGFRRGRNDRDAAAFGLHLRDQGGPAGGD